MSFDSECCLCACISHFLRSVKSMPSWSQLVHSFSRSLSTPLLLVPHCFAEGCGFQEEEGETTLHGQRGAVEESAPSSLASTSQSRKVVLLATTFLKLTPSLRPLMRLACLILLWQMRTEFRRAVCNYMKWYTEKMQLGGPGKVEAETQKKTNPRSWGD